MEADRRPRRALVVIVTILVFVLATRLQDILVTIPWYRQLYDQFPFYVPETIKSCLQILLVLVALAVLHRLSTGGVLREAGIRRPSRSMIAVTVLATLPMWVVFALTTPVATNISVAAALYLAVLSPFAEEVVFRGFAFRQLYRHASFGFWPSVLVTSIVFSLGHLEKSSSAGQWIGIAAITFVGGGFFAWLFMRWEDNVFAPFVVHSLMNLAWQVFSVGETAFAGWLPTVMQGSVLVLAVVLTLVLQRRAAGALQPRQSVS